MIKTKTDARALRRFGLQFAALVLVLFGLLPLLRHRPVLVWPYLVAATFALFALLRPLWLAPIERLWLGLGHALGAVNSRLLLGLIYVSVFVPTALVRRWRGLDRLGQKHDHVRPSYRVLSQSAPAQQMERIF